jgi:fatty acid desaturase
MDDDEDDDEEDPERLQLPIFSYFALVVGYCAIGSALFNAWEDGAVWSAGIIIFPFTNALSTMGESDGWTIFGD